MWNSNKWNPQGKHCYITGGGSGLGLAVATMLASRGAHISIVGRDANKLSAALSLLEQHRQDSEQVFASASHSLASAKESTAALDAVIAKHGGNAPDVVFLCAGLAQPKFFVEMTEEDLTTGMQDAYWLQAWTAWAVTKLWVRHGAKDRKLVFVSSTVGYISFIGYSSYSPGKHAVRGLADTLRSELQLYGYTVHVFFPTTMYTPAYEIENQTKPKITLAIEEADTGLTAEQAAQGLLNGIEQGHSHITADMITEMFRASTRGASPGHNYFWDGLLSTVGHIAALVWRRDTDARIRAHRAEHLDYLEERGFFKDLGSTDE